MLRFCLCVLLGSYVMQHASRLPSAPWLISLSVIGAGLLLLPGLRLAAALLSGYVLTAVAGSQVISSRLDAGLEGQVQQFTARIVDFPSPAGDTQRLVVSPRGRPDLPARIRLSWYEADAAPQIGETWALAARLRAPRGFANPQVFDYEAWLFRHRIGASGYVVSAERRDSQPGPGWITRLRRHFIARVHALLPDDAARAVLTAITIGARQDISRDQWDRYARTGTSHLMAISGLHVGLAAAGLYVLLRVFAAPLVRGQNLRDLGIVFAAAGAAAYALVSGLAVPAQRALLMVLLASLALLSRRQLDGVRALACAGLAVFVGDPLATLAPGFQLSFLAVTVLLWSTQQAPHCATDTRTGRLFSTISRLSALQFTLLLGLMPLTILHFGRIAWLAPFVNLLVLPVFNLLTVPLALLAMLLDGPLHLAGDALLRLAHVSVAVVLWVVNRAAELPQAALLVTPLQGPLQAVSWCPVLWAILPPGFPGRGLAWISVLALVLYKPPAPPLSCVDVHVLDVGQGLSVVMQTRTRIAVFDTGPVFRSGTDIATLVLEPFIRALGGERIDLLIVSHADLDHAGGVNSLRRHLPVSKFLGGEALPADPAAAPLQTRCTSGQAWRWDGVVFRILHPPDARFLQGNDASCVLEISAGDKRVLLTGDIESAVERQLVAQRLLSPTYLVVIPHHGSRTSSSPGFVHALGAEFAIASAGFGNRWGFPRPEVVKRWQDAGAQVLTTATSGAISQRVCAASGPQAPILQRRAYRRYWHAAF